MLRTLLKKEASESVSRLLYNRKNGKRRSEGVFALFALLFAYCFGCVAYFAYFLFGMLCETLTEVGLDWLYFALCGLLATVTGILGSVFTAYSTLYKAKDNDLLFSLPIPPRTILLVRMLKVYLYGWLFEALLLLPAELAYCHTVSYSATQMLCFLPVLLFVPIFAFFLSCLLGSVLALLSGFVRNKTVVQMVTSLLALGLYFGFLYKGEEWALYLIQNSASLESAVRKAFFPFYLMGLGAIGDPLSLLGFSVIPLALAVLLWLLLSKSLLRLGTVNRGERKTVSRSKTYREKSVTGALFGKELLRFRTCAAYMLNSGIGGVMLLVAAIVLPFKGAELSEVFRLLPSGETYLPLMIPAFLCLMLSNSVISAPSISLEGDTLWILQSSPVGGWKILLAKFKFHLLIAGVPALIFFLVGTLVFQIQLAETICSFLFTLAFLLASDAFGLVMGLKFPHLHWTSETAAVKQSMSVLFSMLGCWATLILLVVGYALLHERMGNILFLLSGSLLLALVTAALLYWIKRSGSRIIERLCA